MVAWNLRDHPLDDESSRRAAADDRAWCTWRRLRTDSPEAIGFAAFLGGVVGAPSRRGVVRRAWNHFYRLTSFR